MNRTVPVILTFLMVFGCERTTTPTWTVVDRSAAGGNPWDIEMSGAAVDDEGDLREDAGPIFRVLQERSLHWIEVVPADGGDVSWHSDWGSVSRGTPANGNDAVAIEQEVNTEEFKASVAERTAVSLGVASDTLVRRPDRGETNWASSRCRVNGAFSPDGSSLATVGIDQSRKGSRNTLRVWNMASGKERFKVDGHMRDVSPIAFSTDGAALACGTYGKGVVVRQTTTGKKLLTLPLEDDYAACLTFSPDGDLLAAGTYGTGTVLIWRLSGQQTTGIAEPSAPAAGEDTSAEP